MEFSELEVFLAVVREGNMTKAAVELHCVQSNVTARIKKLEAELGVTLFVRNPRQLQLTSQGELLLAHAKAVVARQRQLLAAFDPEASPSGRLLIGSSEAFAVVFLPTFLEDYAKRYPRVTLTLRTDSSDRLQEAVLSGKLDAAFLVGDFEHPRLFAWTLMEDQLLWVRKKGSSKSPQRLLARYPGCSVRNRAERAYRLRGVAAPSVAEFNSTETLLAFAAAGLGETCLSESYIRWSHLADQVELEPLGDDLGKIPVQLVLRRGEEEERILRSLLEAARRWWDPAQKNV